MDRQRGMETEKLQELDSLERLKHMCRLFREHGNTIAGGQAKLSLTSNILYEVNKAFEDLENNLCPQHLSIQSDNCRDWHGRDAELEEWNDNLQLLRDVFAKATILKLHNGSTDVLGVRHRVEPIPTPYPVHVGCFSHLQHLEISYLPAHQLLDLLKLRAKLVTLVVRNCLGHGGKLQDLLEVCDQQVSVPMPWSSLKTLSLRCNGLKELDGSLRLCPVLETLDISLNRLTSTDVYLGYLMELLRVDLRSNHLYSVPILAATVKKKLRILLLGGNNLTNITGVEELPCLVELDLSENLLSNHCSLEPLKHLHHLQNLDLRGCPVAMRKKHRVATLQCISPLALHLEIILDGRPVSNKEVREAQLASVYHTAQHRATDSTKLLPIGATHCTVSNTHLVASNLEEKSSTVQPSVAFPSRGGKRKGRKKVKARTMEIADMDLSTGEFSSGTDTPRSSPQVTSKLEAAMRAKREEIKQTQQELERMRLHYGDNWLQAIVDQKKLPSPSKAKIRTAISRTETVDATATASSFTKAQASVIVHTPPSALQSGDSYYPDISVETCAKEGVSIVQKASFCESLEIREHKPSADIYSQKARSRQQPAKDKSADELDSAALVSDCAAGDDALVSKGEVRLLRSPSSRDNMHVNSTDVRTKSPTKGWEVNEGFCEDKFKITGKDNCEGKNLKKRKEQTEVSEETREENDVAITVQEPDGQSEPFIVILPEKNREHLIVTVSPRFLVEKDINGRLQEMLDLQCLLSVKLEAEDDPTISVYDASCGGGHEVDKVLTVRMQFNYIRKDRRSRVYIMEDQDSSQQFMSLVQPFVEAKEQAALQKMQTEYECLKCNKVFTRGSALTNVQEQGVPLRSHNRDFAGTSDLSDRITLMCPTCSSDHVVLLAKDEGEAKTAAVVLPFGSVPSSRGLGAIGRNKSFDQLLGSQSWKGGVTAHKEGRTNSERRASGSFRSLAPIRDYFSAGRRDEATEGSSSVSSASSPHMLQHNEKLQTGRHRSNAFYNEPVPAQMRLRSNAFISNYGHYEGSEGAPFGHSLSTLPDAEQGFESQRSGSPSDLPQGPHIESVDRLCSLHKDSSSTWDNAGCRGKVCSVESDITILHKPDSAANLSTSSLSYRGSDSVLEISMTGTPDAQDGPTVEKACIMQGSIKNLDLRPATVSKEEVIGVSCNGTAEVTPMGSPLSGSICSSMVSSIYNNSLQPSASTTSVYATASDSDSIVVAEGWDMRSRGLEGEMSLNVNDKFQLNGLCISQSPRKVSVTSEVEVLEVEEDRAITTLGNESTETIASSSNDYNFDRLDHRITLYLMMNKFDNNEEFRFKAKMHVCQYMVEEEWEALLIATNFKLYIFCINADDISEDPSAALTCRDIQPLGELKQVSVGLGQQTARLEFVTDCSSYTLIFRDADKTQAFIQHLSDHLTFFAMETDLPMATVFIEDVDQMTLGNLRSDVLTRSGRTESLRLYILGYIARGHVLHSPMSFVISSSEMCLVRTNHQWPSPRYQAPVTVDTVGKQFVVLERQKINNIATLTWHCENKLMLRITFFNEKSGQEGTWIITMETEKCVLQMIEAIRHPWEEEFAVKMDVEKASFELNF